MPDSDALLPVVSHIDSMKNMVRVKEACVRVNLEAFSHIGNFFLCVCVYLHGLCMFFLLSFIFYSEQKKISYGYKCYLFPFLLFLYIIMHL